MFIYKKYNLKTVERNTFILKYLAFFVFCFFTMFISFSYAADSVASVFTSQSASGLGSNNSIISVDSNLSYINRWENSSVIGNYFSWYYYDSVLWYFEVGALANQSENARVVWSTSSCLDSYGYKLWGYGYSESFGYIDFDYNDDIFVYYCVWDSQLYGYAYSEFLGFQNFEWITFEILVEAELIPEEPTWTGVFINDSTEILDENLWWWTAWEAEAENSNFNFDSIQNDLLEFDEKYESLFYIIK